MLLYIINSRTKYFYNGSIVLYKNNYYKAHGFNEYFNTVTAEPGNQNHAWLYVKKLFLHIFLLVRILEIRKEPSRHSHIHVHIPGGSRHCTILDAYTHDGLAAYCYAGLVDVRKLFIAWKSFQRSDRDRADLSAECRRQQFSKTMSTEHFW